MNDFSNEVIAKPDGFSAVSTDELEQVEGGLWFIAGAALIGAALGLAGIGAADHYISSQRSIRAVAYEVFGR